MLASYGYSPYLCSDKIPSAARKRKPPQRAAIFVPFQEKGSLHSHLNTTAPRGVADNAPKGIRTWKPCQRVVQFF